MLIIITLPMLMPITMTSIILADPLALCRLLQLTSPALPVGAYSYSEGIEYLCHRGTIANAQDLINWLRGELLTGFIKTETAIALAAAQAWTGRDLPNELSKIIYWNNWLSATRETEEIRLASWQMGQSLIKLWEQLENLDTERRTQIMQLLPMAKDNAQGQGCNYAIAFGLVASSWAIAPEQIAIAYIHSWVANLVSAAVRSVPLGQTVGQQVNFALGDDVVRSAKMAQEMTFLLAADFDKQENARQLEWCGWGASIASANHEVQYSRLFRS